MITLENDTLRIRFANTHPDAACRFSFLRTLRVPDDGKVYPLPAGLGNFELRHTDDFAAKLPASVVKRGGVTLPIWQAEAMWIHFGFEGYPMAVKIAAGKINALTGGAWSSGLSADEQDYVVRPLQPWLDGYSVGKGMVRQFVAAPLGAGLSAEEQLTGAAEIGGLQIEVFPMKPEAYARWRAEAQAVRGPFPAPSPAVMGLAAGGLIRQKMYTDPHGLDAWDQSTSARCFVTLLNAGDWAKVTGEPPPRRPISPRTYRKHHIPWFEIYDADLPALTGSQKLAGLKSIKRFADFGLSGRLWSRRSIAPSPIVSLTALAHRPVRESQL